MKKNISIKNRFTGMSKGRGLDLLSLCGDWLEAHAYPSSALMRPVQLIPIRVQAETRFTPQIHFRRATLNSLPDAGRVRRIELPGCARRSWPE